MKEPQKAEIPDVEKEIQHDLNGEPVKTEASAIWVETRTLILETPHFRLRGRAEWVQKVRAAKPKGQRGLVREKMRPQPWVETIPPGSKDRELDEMLKAVLFAEA